MKEVKFSIIIPIYNVEEKLLKRCIESVLQQDYKYYELLLIDDGSTDGSGDFCDEIGSRSDKVKVFHKSNGGVTTARNFGIDKAIGDYIVFIDNDDWIDKNYLNNLNSIINDNINADIVYFNSVDVSENGETKDKCLDKNQGMLSKKDVYEMVLDFVGSGYKHRNIKYGFLEVWGKVYSRDFINRNKLRFFEDMTIADDLVFNLSCLLKLEKGIYYYDQFLYYRFNNTESDVNRYHSEIQTNDRAFINHLNDLLINKLDREDIQTALTKRYVVCANGVIQFDMIHKKNPKGYIKRLQDLKSFVKSEPYKTAIKNCKISWLNSKRMRICTLLLRFRLFNCFMAFNKLVDGMVVLKSKRKAF